MAATFREATMIMALSVACFAQKVFSLKSAFFLMNVSMVVMVVYIPSSFANKVLIEVIRIERNQNLKLSVEPFFRR